MAQSVKKIIILGGVCILGSTFLLVIIPWIIFPLTVRDCGLRGDLLHAQVCDVAPSGWLELQNISETVGLLFMPFFLGALVRLCFFRSYNFLQRFGLSCIAGLVYVVGMALVEVLRFEPWKTFVTPAGLTYSKYSLRAVYGPFSPAMLLAVVLGWSMIELFLAIFRKKLLTEKKRGVDFK